MRVKKKVNAGRKSDDGTAEEMDENSSHRQADADARVAGIEAMLKDMSSKLDDTQAAADEAARKADASDLEGQALKKQLELVMSEKNAVERMLEEMAKMKEAAEEAAESAAAERAKMRDENKNLLDTVTVLTDARAADHAARAVTVRRWRNELVAYTEKSPAAFLAEVLELVRDMDNDVEVELVDANLAAARVGGGARVAKGEELQLDDEWTHNPALAMARPDRLCRLASKTRKDPRGTSAVEGASDAVAGPASLAAAGASRGRGASGVEVNVSTPRVAAKRRSALAAVDANVVDKAATAAACDDLRQLQHLERKLEETIPAPTLPESPAMLVRCDKNDDGLVAMTAADVENINGSAGAGHRANSGAAFKVGFSAEAAVDFSGVFKGVATGGKTDDKAAAAAAAASVHKPVAVGAGADFKKLGADIDMYDDFADTTPAAGRGTSIVANN